MIRVRCENAFVRDSLEKQLVVSGILADGGPVEQVLVDLPRGWILEDRIADPQRTIIVSDNPCPEYKLDLLELRPAALVEQLTVEAIGKAVRLLQSGQAVSSTASTCLTPTERFSLRLIASGRSVEEAAAEREVKAGTMRNTVHMLYSKLGLSSAVQLSHYYYGNWALLRHLCD